MAIDRKKRSNIIPPVPREQTMAKLKTLSLDSNTEIVIHDCLIDWSVWLEKHLKLLQADIEDYYEEIPEYTEGSIPFADSEGKLIEDNDNLFWNDTNNYLGLGTSASPSRRFHVIDTSTQVRIGYDTSKYVELTVDSNHDLLIKPTSTGQIKLQPTTDSTDFFQILDADGGTAVVNVDSTNERFGVGCTANNTIQVKDLIQFNNNFGNTQLGYQAGDSLTIGDAAVYVGYQAAYNNDESSGDVIIGYQAAYYMVGTGSPASGSVVIGLRAGGYGSGSTHGYDHNVILGSNSAYNLTTGSEDIFLGYKSGYNQTTESNLLLVDNQLRSSANNELYQSIIHGIMASSSGDQDFNINADTVIRNDSSLGSESLNENTFSTHAKWDVTGDFDDSGGNATYTHSTGSGTLTQTSANMAVAGITNRYYIFTFTCSNAAGTSTTAYINTSFASENVILPKTTGTHNVYFQAASTPGDFVIQVSSASSDTWIIDNLYLKELQGGDLTVNGTSKTKRLLCGGVQT